MQIHSRAIIGRLENNVNVGTALVDMHMKCSETPQDALRVFDEIDSTNIVSWTTLISGLADHGLEQKCFEVLEEMLSREVQLNVVTISSVLEATGSQVANVSLVMDIDICAGSNFYILPALSSSDDMRLKGIKPNSMTLTSILFACCLGKLVEPGLHNFWSMKEAYDIEPQISHYVNLVDRLGQAGRLEEAVEILETMPCKPNALIFKKLLGACRFHGNLVYGKIMAMKGVELDRHDPIFYTMLEGLYDDCGEHDLAEKTRLLMTESVLKKNDEKSCVEIRGKVHKFIDGDMSQEINMKLGSFVIMALFVWESTDVDADDGRRTLKRTNFRN